MQPFTRALLRAASIASRPVLSSPKSSTRLLSTRAILPSRPQVSSFVFQRRFNTEDAKQEAVETGTESAHEPFVEEATSTFAAEQDSAIDRAPSNQESVGSPLSWAVEPNNSIYVGNLFFDAKEDDVRDFFNKYGEVIKINLVKDARGYSKGFCFVQFTSKTDAARAVQDAHSQLFAGRRIAVNFAAKKNTVERPTAEPSSTLFVGNLAYDITDKELNALFRPLRNIRDVRVAIDRRTGQPRGFAHADFTDVESAEEAKAHLDGKGIRGRNLKVDYSASNRNRFTPSQSESQPEE